jgi:hypothetical protein
VLQSQAGEIDLALGEAMAEYYADPLGFVMFAYPWTVNSSIQVCRLKDPWAERYQSDWGPDEWACRFLDDLGDEVSDRGFDGRNAVTPIRFAATSGHGVGKSAMSGWLTDWIMSTRPFAQGTVTANTATQLETKTWAQIAKWTKLCVTSHWFRISTGRGSMKMASVAYPEQWFCTAQTCREENSEAFAGQHAVNSTSFYINDESSAIPDAIFKVQKGGLTDGESMQFKFGNPTRNTGEFRECWRKNRKRWRTYRIDSRNVQITNKAYLQELIDDNGIDSDLVKVRVLGTFPSQSFKQFISEDLVDKAVKVHLTPNQYSFAPSIIGVDPAWSGDDDFVIYLRQGLYSKLLGKYPKNDNDVHMANIIAGFQDEYKSDNVFVDGGFGTGIASAGQTMNRSWTLIWFNSKSPDIGCQNMRAHMWNQGKQWLKNGGAIEDNETLRQDLIGPETVARPDGKIQLESKEDMKKRNVPSPNHADALFLTFAAEVIATDSGNQGKPAKHDFDPYAMDEVA